MFFASDNGLGASDRIMAAIAAANDGSACLAYGRDDGTARVERLLSDLFEREVGVFMVTTGTAANGLALSTLTPPWGIVLCHDESHVMEDECCGPEFFTGGAKLVGIRGPGAKITPEALEATIASLGRRVPHNAPIHALSLTQSTELGLVYSVAEVTALSAIAKANGAGVHMDGARFANAVAALGCSPAEITWKAGVDVLSFGTTKNGALACEAIVYFDPARGAEMVRRRMRAGHLLSKHRFLAAQMEAFLADDHWLDLARHANAMAARLAEGLATVPGVRLPIQPQANGLFPIMPDAMVEALKAEGAVFYPWSDKGLADADKARKGETMMRLVTSFATRGQDVERFVAVARGAASAASAA
ncbi:threonine aldolase family protein [Phreatobacter sp.]|uniref:threonine aldolase family protein n=1 Tax=Phreatobacter sp. TaxID=1966341 RepID=UPI003F7137B4